MDLDHLLARIEGALDQDAYLTPANGLPIDEEGAVDEIRQLLHDPSVEADAVRRRIQQLDAAGRLARTTKLSALGVLAASPKVRDYAEAARLAGQQELAAWDEGGELLPSRLASVERHRGVLAFLMGRPSVALDWFGRALERQRTAENLGNVLAALLRLGEGGAALQLLDKARHQLPAAEIHALATRIDEDGDLVALRPHRPTPLRDRSGGLALG
jgi:tetratricopeptide (TPR) repeat protein